MSMCGYRDEEEEHKIGDRNPLIRTMAFFFFETGESHEAFKRGDLITATCFAKA